MKKLSALLFLTGLAVCYSQFSYAVTMQDIEGKIEVQKQNKNNSEVKNSYIKQRDNEMASIDKSIKLKQAEISKIKSDKSLTDTEKNLKIRSKKMELDKLNAKKVTSYKLYNSRINAMK